MTDNELNNLLVDTNNKRLELLRAVADIEDQLTELRSEKRRRKFTR